MIENIYKMHPLVDLGGAPAGCPPCPADNKGCTLQEGPREGGDVKMKPAAAGAIECNPIEAIFTQGLAYDPLPFNKGTDRDTGGGAHRAKELRFMDDFLAIRRGTLGGRIAIKLQVR